jgi:drug/metabolite transporter (DMT)-like permease
MDSFAGILPRTIFIGSVIFYSLYFVLLFGLFYVNKTYVDYIHIAIQIIISLFLIIRFHPFRKHVLESGDSAVIFSSAMFLLTSLGVTQYTYYITSKHVKKIPIVNTLLDNTNTHMQNTSK